MIEISREYEIQAAHRLPNAGPGHKCARMHGHTWRVRLVVTGVVDPLTGWIVDYADMDDVWGSKVHAKLDHTVLNNEIPNPTTEHIVGWIYAATAEALAELGARVVRIEVSEGSRGMAILHVDQPRSADAFVPYASTEGA